MLEFIKEHWIVILSTWLVVAVVVSIIIGRIISFGAGRD